MEHDPNAPPVNPLPPVIVALSLAIFAVEAILQAGASGLVGGPGAIGWRNEALQDYGFYEPLFDRMLQTGTLRPDYAYRFFTYPFVHGSFTQMVFAVVFILALGKMVGEAFSTWAVLAIFFGASVAGAIAYGLAWDTRIVLHGAFPAAYGFIGAFSWLLWNDLAGRAENRLSAFRLIAFLMGLQLLWGLIFGASGLWVADLAGFAMGFVLSFLVRPGGWRALVAKMRQR